MIGVHHKAKHFLFLTLKIVVIALIIAFLIYKWQSQPFSIQELGDYMVSLPVWLVIILPALSLSSWLVESKKWQILVRGFRELCFRESVIHNLTAQATSFLTPMRAGEFVTKPLFFSIDERKNVLKAVFTGNLLQMTITVLLGIPALIFLLDQPFFLLGIYFIVAVVFIAVAPLLGRWLHFSSEAFYMVLLLSLVRYVIFASVWLILIGLCDVPASLMTVIAAVSGMYLMVSILPILQWMDIVVRLGAAQFFLSMLGIESAEIILLVFIVWINNTILPTIIGSAFLINVRYPKKSIA